MAADSRLRTALSEGLLTLPEGKVHVMRPDASYDVAALPTKGLSLSHSFAPDHTAWSQAGYDVTTDATSATVIIVVVPRAKALARGMIAQAAARAELVIVDGQKTDGIDSLFKECRKLRGNLPTLTKAHGRLFWMPGGTDFSHWMIPDPVRGGHGFVTTAGVYSADGVDRGSALLANSLPAKLPARIADLGAGWGYLSVEILKRDGVRRLDLIEAEQRALACARQNVTDSRANFHWADACTWRPDSALDAVIMNPPFHAGRASDPALGRTFITAAQKMLAPHGKLWMVANRHLPYESHLRACFRNVDELPGDGGFKVFHATRPLR